MRTIRSDVCFGLMDLFSAIVVSITVVDFGRGALFVVVVKDAVAGLVVSIGVVVVVGLVAAVAGTVVGDTAVADIAVGDIAVADTAVAGTVVAAGTFVPAAVLCRLAF